MKTNKERKVPPKDYKYLLIVNSLYKSRPETEVLAFENNFFKHARLEKYSLWRSICLQFCADISMSGDLMSGEFNAPEFLEYCGFGDS